MAYRADIEIGVRGVRQLEQLRSEVNKTAAAVDSLNTVVGARGGLVQSIRNYANQLDRAAQSLQNVGAGTRAETKAINEYVTALGQANQARARQNALIDAEIKRRQEVARVQRLTAAGIFETTRYAKPIGPQPSPLQGQSSPVAERISRAIAQRRDEEQLQQALLRLEQRKASELNNQLQIRGELNAQAAREVRLIQAGIRATTQYTRPIGPGLPPSARGTSGARVGGGGNRAGDILSNAVIGGAFPLLFGQGGAAATGGAVGGIAGGIFGGAGGFAGSLLGTLIGGRIGQANQVKELATDIGFTAQQTNQLAQAFKQAGADFDKFQQSVSRIQGLGLSIEDQAKAIQLASGLTEAYGGKIDKVTNAFTNALQTGKVTQATLNQLTSQGIPIQEALAAKYDVSRSKLLQMAKDGKISVQTLIDTLVQVGNTGIEEAAKTPDAFQKGFEEIKQALSQLYNTFVSVFDDTSRAIAESTGRGVAAALEYIKDFIRGVEILVSTVGPLLDGVVSSYIRIQSAIFGAVEAVPSLTTAVLGFVATVAGPLSGIAGVINSIRGVGANAPERQGPYVPARLQRAPLQSFSALGQLPPSSGGGKGKSGAGRESRVPELTRELDLAKKLRDIRSKIFAAELAEDKQTMIRLQLEEKLTQINGKRLDIMASKDPAQEKELRVQLLLVEADEARAEAAKKFIEYQNEQLRKSLDILGVTKSFIAESSRLGSAAFPGGTGAEAFRTDLDLLGQQKTALEEIQKKYPQIGMAAQSAADMVTLGVSQMVAGTTSLQQVFADFLRGIGDMLVQSASQMIATYIAIGIAKMFAFGGSSFKAPDLSGAFAGGGGAFNPAAFGMSLLARAGGGAVSGQQPYLVGERGPELFVPGTGGSVVPTSDLRSAMGSAPGSGGAPVLNMSFETTSINGVEYVSREQLEAAMAATRRQAARDGAQRGMTMTLDRLQQSPNARRRVGI